MKIRLVSAALALLALLSSLSVAAANQQSGLVQYKPMFAVLRYRGAMPLLTTGGLPTWNGSYTYKKNTYTYTMVGTNPAKSGATTTIPVYIIPIKLVYGSKNGSKTFDPLTKILGNGKNIVQNIMDSPIFDSSLNFTQGGTDLGTTQYIDAYQRGNFWSSISTMHPGYHVLLGTPTVLAEQTIHVTAKQGLVVSAFGTTAGLMNYNDFDAAAKAFISSFAQLNPGVLPIFVTDNVYLSTTSDVSGCCIGGYHSFNGAITYIETTYVFKLGAFAQDVSALSHEVGEWMDDPFANNVNVPASCGTNGNQQQILEVGDPLEGDANFGAYPYLLNGFKYNLQDLVLMPYFGAPASKSVNGWFTFQGTPLTVCENGG